MKNDFIRVCGWCKLILDDSIPPTKIHEISLPSHEQITHGICTECADEMRKGIAQMA